MAIDEDRARTPAGFVRRRRVALGGALAVVALAAGLWSERRPIAGRVADDWLAQRHVQARYTIAVLGPGRQRLTGVVIGDPVHPDLVADWIETETSVGLGGVTLAGVRAGQVRARGTLVGGRLSLGAIDRLLPAGSGGGGLPALALDIAGARLRLATPAGEVTARLAGKGRLDRGFDGRLALAAVALSSGGCRVSGAHATLRVRTGAKGIGLAGPVETGGVRCGLTGVTRLAGAIDATLAPDLASWRGSLQVAAEAIDDPRAKVRSLAGRASFAGTAGRTEGTLALDGEHIAGAGVSVERGSLVGRYALGAAATLDAELVASGARLGTAALAALRRGGGAAAGTPLAPLARQAGEALTRAAGAFGGTARVALLGTRVTLTQAALSAASGSSARFAGTLPVGQWRRVEGTLALAGGGLPTLDLGLTPRADGAIEGALVVQPYAAGGARLALTPVALAWTADGALHAGTIATLSGPLGDGAVDGLTLPIALRRDPRGRLRLGERCTPLAFERLALGGLRLAPARVTLCPIGGALVEAKAGRIGGGARTGPVHLVGRLGDAPLDLMASGVRVSIAGGTIAANGVAATLGTTRLAAVSVEGRIAAGGVAGRFAGLGGRIGAVPLLMSDGAGDWRFAGGALTLGGALGVADADAPAPRACPAAADAIAPRFCPMLARDVSLRLAAGRVDATGTLVEPASGARVAAITIAHDPSSGAGHADLAIDALSFDKRLQPDRLTPVVRGVVADVAGTIDGRAHIAWDAGGGVTSTGRFATAGLDLAAAFGPVTGLAGSIAFTDLLGLVSAAGQEVTVRSINPGIAVENGTVRFHTEPGVKLAVEAARWPFAGGTLTLDPTLLDFSAPAERRLTFRVDGIAADRFLQQFEFKNLAATGTFDGVLPMVFDAQGGRIEQGRLTVRESGGGIAYVGDLSQKELGFWGDLAFQALKSLRYRSLTIAMNGPLDGEMVTEVRFAGVSQGTGAKSNFLIRRLQRLPFIFNVRIRAPFRALIQTTGSLSDPSDLLRSHLPALLAPVQGGASPAVPEAKRP